MVKRDHALAGIEAKIERADEHINILKKEIKTLIDTFQIVSDPNDDATESILRIVGSEPPLRLAIITGEIVHQLRSSLDHLVWQLVIANKNTPTRQHQFPICDTRKDFESACERDNIKGISSSAKSIIESRQPYSKSKDVNKNFLHVLREIDNSDKHRLLTFLVAKGVPRELKIGTVKSLKKKNSDPITIIDISLPSKAQRISDEGAETLRLQFDKPEPNVNVTGKPIIKIVFGDLGEMTDQQILYIIQQLRKKVYDLINSFQSEFH